MQSGLFQQRWDVGVPEGLREGVLRHRSVVKRRNEWSEYIHLSFDDSRRYWFDVASFTRRLPPELDDVILCNR